MQEPILDVTTPVSPTITGAASPIIRAHQIQKFYAELLRDGARLGKPLSAKTVRNSHVVLRKALADAERLGLVYRNAAAAARPPTAARTEFATWSSDDLRDFFAGIRDDRSSQHWSCSLRPACGAARSWGCAGPTSTSTPGNWRSCRR